MFGKSIIERLIIILSEIINIFHETECSSIGKQTLLDLGTEKKFLRPIHFCSLLAGSNLPKKNNKIELKTQFLDYLTVRLHSSILLYMNYFFMNYEGTNKS